MVQWFMTFSGTTLWFYSAAFRLVRPLYKKGFSVILLDLPGMGGSGCNANITVEHADWEAEDFRIVENALRCSDGFFVVSFSQI